MKTTRTMRALALAGSAAVLSIALSSCSLLDSFLVGGSDAPRDDQGNVTEEGNIDVFSLEVGDCMPTTDASTEITDVDVVPCSEPHTDEVFFEFELTGDALPSDDEIRAEVETQCLPAFEDFIGIPYEESTLAVWWMTPTEETWSQANDRLVQCIVFEPDPADATGNTSLEVTESFEGAAR